MIKKQSSLLQFQVPLSKALRSTTLNLRTDLAAEPARDHFFENAIFGLVSWQLTIICSSPFGQGGAPATHLLAIHFSVPVQYFPSLHSLSKAQYPAGLLGMKTSALEFAASKDTKFFLTTKLCSPLTSHSRALVTVAVNSSFNTAVNLASATLSFLLTADFAR